MRQGNILIVNNIRDKSYIVTEKAVKKNLGVIIKLLLTNNSIWKIRVAFVNDTDFYE